MTIKLYDLVGKDPSRPFRPHCWKVTVALAHKELAFEGVPTRFTKIASIEDGARKTIPVLRDGDVMISDSFEIRPVLPEASVRRLRSQDTPPSNFSAWMIPSRGGSSYVSICMTGSEDACRTRRLRREAWQGPGRPL